MWRLLRGFLLATAVVWGGEVMVLAAARSTYRNLFAPYAGILPGQPIDTVRDFSCELSIGMRNSVEVGYCHFEPSDDVFAQVSVIAYDRVITQTDFVVRSNSLMLGDLVLCWGKPIYILENIPYEGMYINLYWTNQVYARVRTFQDSGSQRYMMPVLSLSVAHEWQPVSAETLFCA